LRRSSLVGFAGGYPLIYSQLLLLLLDRRPSIFVLKLYLITLCLLSRYLTLNIIDYF